MNTDSDLVSASSATYLTTTEFLVSEKARSEWAEHVNTLLTKHQDLIFAQRDRINRQAALIAALRVRIDLWVGLLYVAVLALTVAVSR